jgi:hypothetical protein
MVHRVSTGVTGDENGTAMLRYTCRALMHEQRRRQREAMVDKGRFLTKKQAEEVSMRLYTARVEQPVVRYHSLAYHLFLQLADASLEGSY